MHKILTGNPTPGQAYEVQVVRPDGRIAMFHDDNREVAVRKATAPIVINTESGPAESDPADEATDSPAVNEAPKRAVNGKPKNKS